MSLFWTRRAMVSEIVSRCIEARYHVDLFFLVSLPFNSPGMYRGIICEDGLACTAIFSDEEVS